MNQDPVAVALFGSETLPRVLTTLLSNPGKRFSFGELQEVVESTRDSLHRALGRGLRAGVIRREEFAGRYGYSAETGSSLYGDLKNLTSRLGGPVRWIAQALEPLGDRVDAAFIYGSVAAGRDNPRSDVDLFVIGDLSSFEVDPLMADARAALGLDLNLVVHPRETVVAQLAKQHPFFAEVFLGPKLMVLGDEASLPEAPLLLPR